ncbi:uncharacterized protein VTP21DRAFT_1262 [Calcarisporiella thermophila]|uniref:uncharacterized protein n=1 Tax=Calcarisporiella thermophila TaxID=911321 RepID=UPI003741FC30
MRILTLRPQLRLLLLPRFARMSTNNRTTHIERTASVERKREFFRAILLSTHQETPTVKSFIYQTVSSKLEFLPGQWLDVHIPNEKEVGGFSLTSTPSQALKHNTFELAVQRSNNPAAVRLWGAQVGDEVKVRVGGRFYISEKEIQEVREGKRRMVAVAGGVGINPIFSMISTLYEDPPKLPVKLLYSARTFDELLFRDRLAKLRPLEIKYFVTREDSKQRIQESDLKEAIDWDEQVTCFVCGPPPLNDQVVEWWTGLRRNPEDIKYERWW